MNKIHSFLFFMLIALAIGCSGPKESFEKKNYPKAFRQSLKKLEKGKSPNENKKILTQSLNQIIASKSSQKNALLKSDEIEQREKALTLNEELQNDIVQSMPFTEDRYQSKFEELAGERKRLEMDIAERYFTRGRDRLEASKSNNNKQLAKSAYLDLSSAKKYGLSTAYLDSLQAVSLKNARVVIVVETNTLSEISYRWEINRQFDNVEDYSDKFRQIIFSPFVGEGQHPDCVIEIKFHDLDFDYDEDSNTENFEKEIIVGYETVTDTSGQEIENPLYGEIEGQVIVAEKTKTASWRVDIEVYSKTHNCTFASSSIEESLDSVIESVTLQGDERAIPGDYKNRRDEESFRSDDDMADELIEQIYRDFVDRYF